MAKKKKWPEPPTGFGVPDLKLSEAILLGCQLTPNQAYGRLRLLSDADLPDAFAFRRPRATCALGAAAEAVLDGVLWDDAIPMEQIEGGLATALPSMTNTVPACAVAACDCLFPRSVSRIVVHLNDDHHWTRERIAAWLAKKGW